MTSGLYMPPQTQYARASGPKPTDPPRPSIKAQPRRSPRRKVYATTSSVLATPSEAPARAIRTARFGRWFVRPFRQSGAAVRQGAVLLILEGGGMTPKVARYLRESVPATPCLVLDVDRVEENYRR